MSTTTAPLYECDCCLLVIQGIGHVCRHCDCEDVLCDECVSDEVGYHYFNDGNFMCRDCCEKLYHDLMSAMARAQQNAMTDDEPLVMEQ